MQYAGERPWGGAQAIRIYGNRLFVPLDVLGLGIFDPATLEMVGRYNYYLDGARREDYFGGMIVRVGDKLIDGSVASRLAALKQTLGVATAGA